MRAKYILQLVLSLILTSSVLAPAYIALVDTFDEKFVVLDSNDEENNKETEKKYDEKELYFEMVPPNHSSNLSPSSSLKKAYLLKHESIDSDILLPPPEAQFISLT